MVAKHEEDIEASGYKLDQEGNADDEKVVELHGGLTCGCAASVNGRWLRIWWWGSGQTLILVGGYSLRLQ